MPCGNADAFGDAGAKFRRCDDLYMTTVTENQALKFVVYNHFQ